MNKLSHSVLSATPASRQKGTMLAISLIILVSMTLAGIAMMRSVDTASIVAGNIAFKQSTTNAADQGIHTAQAWLISKIGSTDLYNDNYALGVSSVGYFSSAPSSEPQWATDSSAWTYAATINGGNPDATGNTVSYVINRLCTNSGMAPGATSGTVTNICGSTPGTSSTCAGCNTSKPNFFTSTPATHYRVTARAVGPRNTVTIVQTLLRTQ